MANSYRDFKKQLEMKREQAETLRMLNNAVSTLTKKRDSYIEQAKTAKRMGNMAQYNAMVALLKNAMVNLAQAQDMVANFTIAKDMYPSSPISGSPAFWHTNCPTQITPTSDAKIQFLRTAPLRK